MSSSHSKAAFQNKQQSYEEDDNYDHCMRDDDDDDDDDYEEEVGKRGYDCDGRRIGFHPDIFQLHVRW